MNQEQTFKHTISKGSNFNQVYIPQNKKHIFEVGDLVEIKLIEKKISLYYSENLKRLSDFKIELIRKMFSLLGGINEIEQAFIIGSFLTSKNEYHDIDVILISKSPKIEERIFNLLNQKFDLKFHVISIERDKFEKLLKICPLVRSMMYYSISNKKIPSLPKSRLDKNYIRFLLMLPGDILEIELNSKVFYESLRRIIAIEKFISNNLIDPLKIDSELIKDLGEDIIKYVKEDKLIESDEISRLRIYIKAKLNRIESLIENG